MADPDLFDRRFVKPSDVLVQELAGEAVLLHVTRGHYFGLNEVGRAVWREIMTGIPVRQAYEHLLTEFDVSPEQLHQDLTSLVQDLLSQGLLEDARA
jgi:coenzyme PQQ synthesis protein D (PqqD)